MSDERFPEVNGFPPGYEPTNSPPEPSTFDDERPHIPLSLRTALEAWGLTPEHFEESLTSHGWKIVRAEPTPQPDENVSPRTARIDDAMQFAIAFMNDPEGLASAREEWRDQLRAALLDFRAIEREASSPALDVERPLFSPDAEHCQKCGVAVGVVWTAPDDLWAAVTGRDDGGGVLCVQCFDDRATEQGRFIRWVPQDESAHLAHPDSDGDAR